MDNTGFENDAVTLTEDFPWSQVEIDLAEGGPIQVLERSIEMSCEIQQRVWSWVYQGDCKDLDGFMCRCILVCWIFVPQCRSHNMTEMAGRFGKKKQSLGRWFANFKDAFPELKHLQHMKHE